MVMVGRKFSRVHIRHLPGAFLPLKLIILTLHHSLNLYEYVDFQHIYSRTLAITFYRGRACGVIRRQFLRISAYFHICVAILTGSE